MSLLKETLHRFIRTKASDPAAQPRKKQKKIEALPSTDEQKTLSNVESLMRSNLLELQVTEVVQQVSTQKVTKKKKVNEWLAHLTKLVENAEIGDDSVVRGVPPRIDGSGSSSGNGSYVKEVRFEKAETVQVIGSHSLQSGVYPSVNVDMAVVMPSSIFEDKDILDYKYFDKRYLYLKGVQTFLESSTEDVPLFEVSMSYFKGDICKPILSISPAEGLSIPSTLCVRLIPVLPDSVMRLVQLRPLKNNVRPEKWKKHMKTNQSGKGGKQTLDASLLPPTPRYNMSILEDLAVLVQQRIVSKTIAPHPGIVGSLVLFKIWQTQRSLRFGVDCLDGHHASLLIAFLVQTRRIATQSSALNAFQTLLAFLATTDLTSTTLDFTKIELTKRQETDEQAGDSSFFPVQLFHPIIYPATGDSIPYNAFWRVSSSCVRELAFEARASLHQLQYNQDNCFDGLFMKRSSFFERHDSYLHIAINKNTVQRIQRGDEMALGVGGAGEGKSGKKNSKKTTAVSVENEHDEASGFTEVVKGGLEDLLLQAGAGGNNCRGGNFAAAVGAQCIAIVQRALGDRVLGVRSHVRCVVKSAEETDVNNDNLTGGSAGSHAPVIGSRSNISNNINNSMDSVEWVITIGLVLNRATLHRKVDRATAAALDDPSPSAAAAAAAAAAKEASSLEEVLTPMGVRVDLLPFSMFWGVEMCQLRRFKDGAIVEAVVWDERAVEEQQRSLTDVISCFALSRHLPSICGRVSARASVTISAATSAVTGAGSLVNAVTSQVEAECTKYCGSLSSNTGSSSGSSSGGVINADQRSRAANEALDALRRVLTSQLTGMPLIIDSLEALSPALRYCALHPPVPHPLLMDSGEDAAAAGGGGGKAMALRAQAGKTISLLAQPLPLIARLESSGKWPAQAAAIQHSKTAMLLQLRALLMQQHKIHSVIHRDSLDICFRGYIFRILLVAGLDVEVLSWDVNMDGDTASSGTSTTPAAVLEAQQHREAVQRALRCAIDVPALHHQCIKSLRASCPSYSGAVRLFQVWTACHCFSGHLSLEAMELLVAYVFTSRGAGSATDEALLTTSLSSKQQQQQQQQRQMLQTAQPPASALAGFHLAIKLLANFKWESEPLIVDMGRHSVDESGALAATAAAASAGAGVAVNESVKKDNNVISPSSRLQIISQFRSMRADAEAGSAGQKGGFPMYIVSSADRVINFHSSIALGGGSLGCGRKTAGTAAPLERAVFGMIVHAAKESSEGLFHILQNPIAATAKEEEEEAGKESEERAAKVREVLFGATPATMVSSRYDVTLVFNKSIVNASDVDKGPKFARLKVFTNLSAAETSVNTLVVKESLNASHPLQEEIVEDLRATFADDALFFWNGLAGGEVGVVWRPKAFLPSKFSILNCQDRLPCSGGGAVGNGGDAAGYTLPNVSALLKRMIAIGDGLIVDAIIN